MSFTITFTKEMIIKAEAKKERVLNSCLSKGKWLSDKKFQSSGVENLK